MFSGRNEHSLAVKRNQHNDFKRSEIESAVELRRRSEMSMNKHATRAAGVSQSIDFVFQCPISPFRQRGEGSGTFPTVDFSN